MSTREHTGYAHHHLSIAREAAAGADIRAMESLQTGITRAHIHDSLQLALAETVTALLEVRDAQDALARAAVEAGMTWAQIGDALGMTKQGAQQRYA